MTKQDGNRPTFWKRASRILKKPFGKRKSSPIESSESESEVYSEDESSLDSCSECDSDAGVEKHRVAALRSQEDLNKSDAYKRNALKRQTKLFSKAIEANQAVEKEQRKNRKSATQIPVISPFAPLLYPNLSPPPSPQPITYGQPTNRNNYQGHRPANNNPFLDSFEDFPADEQAGEILNSVGSSNIHGGNLIPQYLDPRMTFKDLERELRVKYNYRSNDASRLAQQIRDQ
jgi:hypothetical protein